MNDKVLGFLLEVKDLEHKYKLRLVPNKYGEIDIYDSTCLIKMGSFNQVSLIKKDNGTYDIRIVD